MYWKIKFYFLNNNFLYNIIIVMIHILFDICM